LRSDNSGAARGAAGVRMSLAAWRAHHLGMKKASAWRITYETSISA